MPDQARVLLPDSIAFPDTEIFPYSLTLKPEQGDFLPGPPGLSVRQAPATQLPSTDGSGLSGTIGWSPACIKLSGPSESPGRKDSQSVGL